MTVRLAFVLALLLPSAVRANEIWVAPTLQADIGGLGIGSNSIWPVTPFGIVRFAWGVPADLQTFQSAKVVLIPHSPGGAATLNLFICAAASGDPVLGACTGSAVAFRGEPDVLLEIDIGAALAPLVGTPGRTNLAVLAITSPTTTTDHIVGLRFAYEPAPPSGVATLGANTFSGAQTAPAFVGDGSGLANVNAALLNGFSAVDFAAAAHGHDVSQVTNAARLAGGNVFSGTQQITSGGLDLAGTATTGLISRNGSRFLHNFGDFNTFVGLDAGNLTMTGALNTATGNQALLNNTSGVANTAIGSQALVGNTEGFWNTAVGWSALLSNTVGAYNTAIGIGTLLNNTSGELNTASGVNALAGNTTGIGNTATGNTALVANTTGQANTALGLAALYSSNGSRNVAVGIDAGYLNTAGSDNIYLGAEVLGTAEDDKAIYIGIPGLHTKTVIGGIRGTSVAGPEMVVIDSNGRLGSAPIGSSGPPGPNTVGSPEIIDNAVAPVDVSFNYAGSASKGGAASDADRLDGLDSTAFASALHGHDVSQVSNAARLAGGNLFSGIQTVDGNLDLVPSSAGTGNILKGGVRFLHNFGGPASTFLGVNAGNFTTTTVGNNTGLGTDTLSSLTTGHDNTAIGSRALSSNRDGTLNTATGALALESNTDGHWNTATGGGALHANTVGRGNTATGVEALLANTGGHWNTAIGGSALQNSTSGERNVALGYRAGLSASTGSHNVYLGAEVHGEAGESNAIHLGIQGVHSKTVIGGIRGTSVAGPEMVVIDANGRLGSAPIGSSGPPGPDTVGSSQIIDNSIAPVDVAFNYAGSTGKGGPAADLACQGCVNASEVSFSFATLGFNTFTGTQHIASGNLSLEDSTTSTGLIFKAGGVYMHNFGIQNTFLGAGAGNLLMTGGQNVGVGDLALVSIASGEANTALGAESLRDNVGGSFNTAAGTLALSANTGGSNNTAVGAGALQSNTIGFSNTATGWRALSANVEGEGNTATGWGALLNSTSGQMNTAVGTLALGSNVTGSNNAAMGGGALGSNTSGIANVAIGDNSLSANDTGSTNVAVGGAAMRSNVFGVGNTALGTNALDLNTAGSYNVAIGLNAGSNVTTGSNNIYLGMNAGGAGDEGDTMRLGSSQSRAFIAGVVGTTTGLSDAIPVMIDSAGQLGTVSSSQRFKEDIHDMGDASARLFKLHPVTFRYTQPYANGSKPIQFGLIAEEVADVFPELAVRGADDAVETVHYEKLSVLLLNEVQKQLRRIEALERQLQELLGRR